MKFSINEEEIRGRRREGKEREINGEEEKRIIFEFGREFGVGKKRVFGDRLR